MTPSSPPKNRATAQPSGLTLEQYADAKRLPVEKLRRWGLSTYGGKIKIPYHLPDGRESAMRYRLSLVDEPRFRWRPGSKPTLYGLERIESAKTTGSIVVVEGESDCHTLWHHDYHAVGVPGASSFKSAWLTHLDGISTISIVIEPDAGGKQMLGWIAKQPEAFQDRVRLVKCGDRNDPSDLHLDDPEHFTSRFRDALEDAEPWATYAERQRSIRSEGARKDYESVATAKGLAGIGAQRELAQLLDEVRAFIKRYLVLRDDEVNILTVWTVHTFCIEAFDYTPYLAITSATPSAGKTRVLEVLDLLIDDGTHEKSWLTASTTKAVLVRKIDALQPVLLLDETDGAFRGNQEYAEALRSILNSGYSRRSGTASLCIGPQHDWKDFKTFCPKAFAGIGRKNLPDTVLSRSIPIEMKRKRRDERVEKLRHREALALATPIRERIEAWATPQISALQAARPALPPGLEGRAEDVAEPLLAIADMGGQEWARKVRQAAVTLLRETTREMENTVELMLHDTKRVWPGDEPFVLSKALLQLLLQRTESPWSEWRHGKPLTEAGLARILKEVSIVPSHSPDKRSRGYYRAHFDDPWSRYCTAAPPEKVSGCPEANETGVKPEVSTRPETRSADGWPSQDPPIDTGVADTWTGTTGGALATGEGDIDHSF